MSQNPVKKQKVNKITQSSGLALNVNTFKSNMKSYFEQHDTEAPMFSGSPVAMTACIQRMCTHIIKNLLPYVNKDKSGIKSVTRQSLRYSICLNNELNQYYYMKLLKFDKNQIFIDQLPVAKKELDSLVSSVDKSIKFTQRANNLLCFLLLKVYQDLLSVSYEFMNCCKKSTLNANFVLFAIRNRFCDNLSHELSTEVKRAVGASSEEGKENENEEVKDDEKDFEPQQVQIQPDSEDEENELMKTNVKKSSTKKDKKDLKSDKKIDEEEEEEENLEEENLEEENLEEENNVDEPEPSPKIKNKTKNSKETKETKDKSSSSQKTKRTTK